MIDLVIDTSIFRNHPRRDTAAFRALTRLCFRKGVQLHVPYFVKNEFLSQQRIAIRTAFTSLDTSIRGITRHCEHTHLVEFAAKATAEIAPVSKTAEFLAVEDFERWLKRCNVIEYPVATDHGIRVAEDYFSGAPPFTSPKQRVDIPDSFIWHTIIDILKTKGALCVVSNDGALHKAAVEQEGIDAFKHLNDFIDSEQCQNQIEAIAADTVIFNLVRATSFLRGQNKVLISRAESDLVQVLIGKPVVSERIRNSNHKGIIASVGKWSTLGFEFDGVDFYGEREIGIPFNTVFYCQVNYRIEITDFLAMRVKEIKKLTVTQRDTYYDILEKFKINLEATLAVKFPPEEMKDENLSDSKLIALLRDATSEVEVREVDVLDED